MSSKPDAPSLTRNPSANSANSASHHKPEPTERTPSDSAPTNRALEDLASELTGQAADKWRGHVPDALLRFVASRVRSNLITTSEGRTRLQRCFSNKPTPQPALHQRR